MLQINFTNIKIRKRKTSAETKVEEKKIEGLKQVGPLEPKERHFEERSLPKNTDEEIKLVEPEEDEKAKLTKHANAKELESKRKNPEEKNKDVHIKLHIKSDNDFKDLLLDIYFDKNAPNIFTNGDAVRWHPTVEEMDSVLEAFDIISQPLTNPGKKIDDLSKKFYFYDKKNKNDQPISDLKPDETDKSGIKNTYDYTFKKEEGKTPKEPKIPEFLEEPSNEKPERTTEEQKIKEIEEVEPTKQPESEENRKDEKPTKPENNHFQETDETEEIVLTPPAKSAKTEEIIFNPEQTKIDEPTSDSKQDKIDKSDIKNIYMDIFKKEQKIPKEPKFLEEPPNEKPVETEEIEEKEPTKQPESEENKTLEMLPTEEEPEILEEPSNEKPERTTEEQKIKEIEEVEPTKQPESEENRKDEKPTKPENNHFQETDETEEIVLTPPAKSAKTEEIIFNPEQTKIDEPTSDSKQDDTDERLRLDKVLFSRVKDA